jgi:peptidoglycan hydrolase-like protein with peptidoglycan-binding domain
MITASLAHLPLATGGAVLSLVGRGLLWAALRYMRAPLANTAAVALVTLSALAGSNALYMQRHEHPAPLFTTAEIPEVVIEPEPVIPAVRPRMLEVLPPVADEATGSLPAEPADSPIGNADVADLQRKLKAMDLYQGNVDGLYGTRTARAVKAFEERAGLAPRGELTRSLLEAVRLAPLDIAEPEVEPLPVPDPLTQVEVPALGAVPGRAEQRDEQPQASGTSIERALAVAAAEAALEPLPAPAPLVAEVAAPELPRPRRELPQTPQQAVDIAVETAGEAIQTIIDGVQSIGIRAPAEPDETPAPSTLAGSGNTRLDSEMEQTAESIETASIAAPRVGVPLEDPDAEATDSPPDEVAVLDTDAAPEELMPIFSVTDPVIVAKVQRGLASLGFLHGPADGIAGEATAKAIRNFEVYYNYRVTGRISPELLDLLVQNGASI